MESNRTQKHLSIFERIRKVDTHNVEYWSARDMAKVLEYSEYRHFIPVIEKAKEACKNSGQNTFHHFEDILEMIEIGN
jgi:DNA-damage-inducible protein D